MSYIKTKSKKKKKKPVGKWSLNSILNKKSKKNEVNVLIKWKAHPFYFSKHVL